MIDVLPTSFWQSKIRWMSWNIKFISSNPLKTLLKCRKRWMKRTVCETCGIPLFGNISEKTLKNFKVITKKQAISFNFTARFSKSSAFFIYILFLSFLWAVPLFIFTSNFLLMESLTTIVTEKTTKWKRMIILKVFWQACLPYCLCRAKTMKVLSEDGCSPFPDCRCSNRAWF